jgi:small subunit ribosomal protein S21
VGGHLMRNNNFDRMLRNFKRYVTKKGVIEEVRKRQYYIKPSEQKQIRINAAKRRAALEKRQDALAPRRGHTNRSRKKR